MKVDPERARRLAIRLKALDDKFEDLVRCVVIGESHFRWRFDLACATQVRSHIVHDRVVVPYEGASSFDLLRFLLFFGGFGTMMYPGLTKRWP